MTDTRVLSPSEVAEEHQQEAHAPYLMVWLWLAGLTGIEYVYAAGLKDFFLILLGGLLALAAIKAALVAWYFMHLKFEGKWVYLLILPALFLAVVLVLALIPDLAMQPADPEGDHVRVEPVRSDVEMARRIPMLATDRPA